MKYALIAVVVLLSWGQPAAAFTWTVIGEGYTSCGAWTKSSRQDGVLHWQRVQWIFGFVTAAAYYTRSDFAKNTDNDGLLGWIDNYCRDNPLDDISDATVALVKALKKR